MHELSGLLPTTKLFLMNYAPILEYPQLHLLLTLIYSCANSFKNGLHLSSQNWLYERAPSAPGQQTYLILHQALRLVI